MERHLLLFQIRYDDMVWYNDMACWLNVLQVELLLTTGSHKHKRKEMEVVGMISKMDVNDLENYSSLTHTNKGSFIQLHINEDLS